jgi:hypothetical protein
VPQLRSKKARQLLNQTFEDETEFLHSTSQAPIFTGAITPRPLLNQLQKYLLRQIPTWTQYQKIDSIWKISGTHDLECHEIERASFVVPALWSSDRVKHLKLDIPVDDVTNLTQAEVKVQVNGQPVKADYVASEAQITDLQLTFMLAMAKTYQWTTWRALLLDDPTQHHDLVHAAAVFDLLRDYISTHDFQVLLTTHDKVQAHFFMRKLQNDGIPVRLWTLRPTDAGMSAIRSE